MSEAVKVVENPEATQEDVNNAVKVLRDAIKGLVSKSKDDSGKNNDVKTGDTAKIAMPIIGIGFAVLLLALAMILRKKSADNCR